MIVANNDIESPHSAFIMGESKDGEASDIEIPCVMLSLDKVCRLLIHNAGCKCIAKIEIHDSKRAAEAERIEKVWASAQVTHDDSNNMELLNVWWEDTKQVVIEAGRPTKFGFLRWTTKASSYQITFASYRSSSSSE